jgi:hypothetical protein
MNKTSFETQIANPISARGLRYKDEGGCFPSATSTLHSVTPVQQFLGNKATYSTVPSGSYTTYLFRDILRNQIQFVAYPGTVSVPATYSYTAQFVANGTTLTPAFTYPADSYEEVAIDFQSLLDTNAGSTSASFYHPHGPALYPGLALGLKCIYMDIGATMTFTQTTTYNSMHLHVKKWDGDSFNNVATTTFTFLSSIAAFTPTSQGYYAFSLTDTTPESDTVSAVLSGNGDVFGHLTIPQVEGQLVNLTQARVLANSVLLSNTASALNVEGSIWAAQFPGSDMWYDRQTSAQIGIAREMYDGRAAKGCYGWLKPYKTSDFDYRPVITHYNGVVTNCSFPLENSSPFVVMVVNTVSTGLTYPGLDLLQTNAVAIEFVTQSQWYESELPYLSTLQRIQAVDALERIPQFHENPTHLEMIYRMAKHGVTGRKHALALGGLLQQMMFAHHAGRKQKVVKPNAAIVKKVVQQVVKQKVRRQVNKDVKKDIRKITKAAPAHKGNTRKNKK